MLNLLKSYKISLSIICKNCHLIFYLQILDSVNHLQLLEHYYSPEELERALGEFIDFYNNNRLHESLNNLAPADVYFNRGAKILKQREEIKHKTILQRRINHLLQIQNQSLSFV